MIRTAFVLALACAALARPDFSGVPGFSRQASDPSRPQHFSYSRVSRTPAARTALAYEADILPGVRSLDVEDSVQAISCAEGFVDLEVSQDSAVKSWGSEFVLVASAEWGCAEGVVLRRARSVEWTSATTARVATSPATYSDVFQAAKVTLRVAAPRAIHNDWTPTTRLSWNHAAGSATATQSPLTWWKMNCDVNCDTAASASNAICELCPAGVEIKSTLQCEDCWADAGVDTIALDIDASATSVVSFDLRVNASAEVELGEVGIKLAAAGDYTHEFPLLSAPVFGYSFNVGTIPIKLGAFVTVSAVVNITKAEAAAKVALSFSKRVALNFEAKTSDGSIVASASQHDGNYAPAVTISASGHAQASVGIRAAVSVDIVNIANAQAWVMPQISAGVNFAYPAIAPLPLAEGANATACNKYHILEYDTAFDLLIGASATVTGHTWATHLKVIPTIDIASGCAVPLESADPLQQYILEFKQMLGKAVAGISDKAYSAAVANEIAAALKISASQILVNINLNMSAIPVTIIAPTPEERESLGNRLINMAAYSDSALWSQSLMSKLQPSYAATSGAAAGVVSVVLLVASVLLTLL